MKPTLVFDFDGVIADTARLKETLFGTLSLLGFTKQEIKEKYEEVKRDFFGQDPAELSRRLADGDEDLEQRLLQAWKDGNKRIIELVHSGILSKIKQLREAGFPVILLTAGRIGVQRTKVKNCGIFAGRDGTFDRIIYVEEDGRGENKIVEMERLIHEFGAVIALDDQPYNIEPFAKHPKIFPVFIRIFSDQRNTDYVPPANVATVTSPHQLTPEFFTTLVSANIV